jgi:hypothetical protein
MIHRAPGSVYEQLTYRVTIWFYLQE